MGAPHLNDRFFPRINRTGNCSTYSSSYSTIIITFFFFVYSPLSLWESIHLILTASTPLPPHPTWEFALRAGWIEQGKDVALDTRRDFVLYPGIDGPLTPSRDAVAHQSSHDWYRGDISARPEDSDAWGLHWYIQRLRETPHSNGAYLPIDSHRFILRFFVLKKLSSTEFCFRFGLWRWAVFSQWPPLILSCEIS